MKSYKTSLFKFLKLIIVMFVLGVIGYFLLSGIINQRKTGESLANYATKIGKNISKILYSIKEGNGPIKIDKNGVYFKDAIIPKDGAVKHIEPAKVQENK